MPSSYAVSGMNGGLARSWARRLLAVPIVVEACVLAWFILLLSEALGPGFRGGRFIVATLLIGTALIVVVLLREVVVALWSGRTPRETAETPVTVEEDAERAVAWPLVGAAVATMAGFFAAILIFGTVLGITVAAWIILRWQSKLDLVRAGLGAVAVGVVLPVVFANLLDLNLWPGLIPQIIPDWIGGGLLPPL